MIQQTSLLAYKAIKPELQTREQLVRDAIVSIGRPCSINDVAYFLGLFPNKISGRFTSLKARSDIVCVDERTNKHGYRESLYGVA